MPLETERLLIRLFDEADVDELYQLVYADPAVRDMWSGYRETLEQFRERFRATPLWHADDGFGFRAVTRKADGALLGLVGLQRYEPGEDTSYIVFADGTSPIGQKPDLLEAELTYAFGRAYWKQGYAAEAGWAVIDEGFTRLGVGRIVNGVLPSNENSINLMRRLGFRIEANHNPRDLEVYGMPGVLGILDRPA
jgi:RimJ/RimL family protein N-acetyltransferase